VGADNATMAFRCTLASTPVSSLWREGEGDAEGERERERG
jgi:hypothetical protein